MLLPAAFNFILFIFLHKALQLHGFFQISFNPQFSCGKSKDWIQLSACQLKSVSALQVKMASLS